MHILSTTDLTTNQNYQISKLSIIEKCMQKIDTMKYTNESNK